MRNSSNNIRNCSMIGCLIGFVVVPILLGANDTNSETNSSRRKQIEGMTQAQRDRLRYNFDSFQSLSVEQKNRFRKIHQTVESKSSLHSTMLAYHNWLKSIDPWQRDEIRRESDPVKRLALVKSYKQNQQSSESWQRGPSMAGLGQQLNRMLFNIPKLKKHDLATIFQMIEDSLPIDSEMQARLNSRQGLSRHIVLIELAVQEAKNTQRFGPARWPSIELTQKIIESISYPEIQQKLKALPSPEIQRQALAGVIVRGLFAEIHKSFEQHKPNDIQLRELLMKLESRDRDEIMRLPSDEAKRRLSMMYFAHHRDKFPQEFNDLRRVMQSIFPRMGLRPQGTDRDRPGFNKNNTRGYPGKKAEKPQSRRRPFQNGQSSPGKQKKKP